MSEVKKTRYIGLCLTRIQEYLENEFFHAAVKRAVECGYTLLVFNAFDDFYFLNAKYAQGEQYVFDHIPYEKLDGLIIMSETIKNEDILHSIIAKAKEHNVFTVSVDKRIEGCYNIEFNYRGAFESIVRHVIREHGAKTINIVAGIKDNEFSDERLYCCKRIMEENGVEFDWNRVMYGNFWSTPTEQAFDEFMMSGLSMPDAFICCNDSMAMTVCSKLKDYGYSVPADVIVTGFDGIYEEQYHIPRLTTAKQDVALAGHKAVDAIVSHMNGTLTENFCIIDHKVVWSHSCGCKKIDYREATGQIIPLFQRNVDDRSFDTYTFEFNSEAALATNLDELGELVLKHSNMYGYHYYVLCLDEKYMNMDSGEDVLKEDNERSERMLVLCENYDNVHYKPFYGEGPAYLDKAIERYSVFLYWSVHFQEKYMGYGITGISIGCDQWVPNDDFRHIVKYTRNLNQLLETSNSQYALKKVIARLQDLYIRDHITGLYNRRGFYTELNQYISEAIADKETERSLIVISVDMDGLKFINDTYGHAEGDAAIKATADALKAVWTDHVICSRFGGDEFTVACVCTGDAQKRGDDIVEKIKAHLEEFNASSDKPYKVKASFGLMHDVIKEGFIADSLIKAADDLMYKEKLSHKESRARCTARMEAPQSLQ